MLTALDVMGYQRPFRHRSEMARLVGMVLPDLHNPIFPAYADAIGGLAVSAGLVPVLCTRTSDGVSEAHYIEMLLARQVAGIVFVAASYADAGPEQAAPLTRAQAADGPDQPGGREPGRAAGRRRRRRWPSTWPLAHLQVSVTSASAWSSARRATCRRTASCRVPRPGEGPRAARRAHPVLDRGRPGRDEPPARAGGDGDRVRQRRPCARRHPGARKQGLDVPGDLSVIGFDDSTYMA